MKRLILILIALFSLTLLTSCEGETWGGEGKWTNWYIDVYENDQEELYVKKNNTKFHSEKNGANWDVEFIVYKDRDSFRLAVTSKHIDIDKVSFSGYYNAENDWKELEPKWKVPRRSFTLKGKYKHSTFYRISLSRDNQK